jgi:hypothetical protein
LIKTILGVSAAGFEDKYLGLPTANGRMKNGIFQPIMKRFTKRLSNWSEKYMSYGAKDTLIKSVIQALPGYTMSVFKMTVGFCENYGKIDT